MVRRTRIAVVSTAAAAALTVGGWAVAAASRPQPSSVAVPAAGHGLQVRYEVRREPAYVPPPPSEADRLEVLTAQAPTGVEDGVLSAQAGQALRSLQAEDDARTAAALSAIRAEDARVDRETASALDDEGPAGAADGTTVSTRG